VGQTTPIPSPRKARGDATRAALVEAATALFEDHGFEATSVDAITAAAGVAKGTFYVHFQRKEDVLLERAARWTVRIQEATPTDVANAVVALRDLGQFIAGTLPVERRALSGRGVRELVGNPADWVRVLGSRPTLDMVIEPLVICGQQSGQLRSDQSARRLARSLTVLWLDNVISWGERASVRPLGRDLDRALDLFLSGATAR
jgi:AcrR family transcriptional regulator